MLNRRQGYESVSSHDAELEQGAQSAPRSKSRSGLVVGVVIVQLMLLGALLFYVISLNHQTNQALQALQKSSISPQYNSVPLVQMPHKLAVDHVTPREDQKNRGTCWDFATISMIEQSYREHGVAQGWLKPDDYVKFSTQAYGIVVTQLCQKHPSACIIPDDKVWMNSTEGGEIPLLYYLPGINTRIMPSSVCPYISDKGFDKEQECPGLEENMAKNPIKFKVKSMDTMYEISSIKNHLRTHKRALGLSTPMTTVSYFYPCAGRFANRPECKTCSVPCPFDRFPAGSCCVRQIAQNFNMEGEFYTHGKTDFKDGGHAMALVGYNDNYVTESGAVGGFILKNNWAGSSHSVQYFMQDISRMDESRICPNSRNPRNWYDCKSINHCLSGKIRLFADVAYQPLELRCRMSDVCNTHADYVYFVKNASHIGDDMVEMCFIQYNQAKQDVQGAEEFCLGPYVMDEYAMLFEPVKILKDDPDRCGFYFFPYDLIRTWWANYHDGFATDFDIEWESQSYAANKAKFPEYDYTLVERSTHNQNKYVFSGPFPRAVTAQD